MSGGRRILIAGIASHWGSELARSLGRDPEVERVIGIDSVRPSVPLPGAELLEADIRTPAAGRLIAAAGADTLVHAGIVWYPEPDKPARALHDINVIGTLKLLAACERSPTIERIVVRGSAAIYGCEPAGPSFFSEEMARSFPLRTRFQRDIGELEGYFENFARRNPHVACCMLRYQPELGPGLATPLVRYLSLPVVPVQLGFDPRLQLLHADDATGALRAAALRPLRGAVNVAPTGSISLSHVLRLLGRRALPVPHPLFGPAMARLGGGLGVGPLQGDAVRLLRYGRGVDNARLTRELGYEPRYDAAGAIRELAASGEARRPAPSLPPGLGRLTERLARAVR